MTFFIFIFYPGITSIIQRDDLEDVSERVCEKET